MKRYKTIFWIFFFLCVWAQSSYADDKNDSQFKWAVGEELFYKVKYTFLTIGSLHIQVIDKDTLRDHPVYYCKLRIRSSDAIPFVDIDDTYESYIDEDVYAHAFIAYEKQRDYWLYTRYDMLYDSSKIKIRVERHFRNDTTVTIDSTAALPTKVQDGLSLLFYARARAKNDRSDDVPVFAFNELKATGINFKGKREEVKVKGEKVNGYYLDGKMKFVGIAGIKEDFEGWFSPEPQSVPVFAKMKAFIGSVKINLEWWRNWDGETVLGKKVVRENAKESIPLEED